MTHRTKEGANGERAGAEGVINQRDRCSQEQHAVECLVGLLSHLLIQGDINNSLRKQALTNFPRNFRRSPLLRVARAVLPSP